MRNKFLAITLISLLPLVGILPSRAAMKIRAVDGGKYAWLLDQSINGICQDNERFLWISTYGGLLRYDGSEFQLMAHDPDNPSSLSNNNVGLIYQDPVRGGIWACTYGGLDYFNPEKGNFDHASLKEKDGTVRPLNKAIRDLLILPDKIMCCSGAKFFLCDSPDEGFVFHQVDLGLTPVSICKYDEDHFCALDHLGVYMLDSETLEIIAFAPSQSSYYDYGTVFYCRETGRIYVGNSIGTKSSVFRFENGMLVPDSSFVPDNLHKVCFSNGKTLFGTNGNGLYILENEEVTQITTKNGLASNVVTSFCHDAQDNLWLGQYRGGLMLSQNMTESMSVVTDLKMVSSVIPDEKTVYVGMDSYGLGIYDRSTGSCRILNTDNSRLPGNHIVSMTKLGDEIWMAVYTKGLCSYNTVTKAFRTYSLAAHDELYVDNNKTWIVRHDDKKRIWVGGPSLFLFSPETRSFTSVDGLASQFISSLSFNGPVAYVSTRHSGIYKVDSNTLEILERYNPQTLEGFPENDIRYCFMDSHGRLWFDSQTFGLYSYDESKRKLTRYRESDGLRNGNITTINEDADGNLWMGSMNGLYFYSYASGHFIYLGNDAFIPAQYLFSSGIFHGNELFLGSTEGLVFFDVDRMETQRTANKVTFTGLNTLSKEPQRFAMSNDSPSPVKLKNTDNSFQVSFSVPEYNFPESVRFSFRLKGRENEWLEIGNLRFINFFALKAGDYTLEVRYAYMDESWSEPSSLNISIAPKWYATGWARILGLLALLGAIIILFRLRMKQQKIKEEIRMAEFEKKSIREMNEAKMDFFTRIVHDIRVPVFLISTQLESITEQGTQDVTVPKLYLDSLLRNSRKLTRLVSRLIDFRKLDSGKLSLRLREGDIAAFCDKLAVDYMELCSKKSIRFQYKRPDGPVRLSFDAEKVESILSNLISNAFKYTNEGGKVTLSVEQEKDAVRFSVADTGIGISPEDQERIFEFFFRASNGNSQGAGDGIGLSIVRSLVEVHGGKITVDSRPGEGSTFSFTIPFGLTANNLSSAVIEDDTVKAPADKDVQVSVSNPAAAYMILIIDDDTDTADLLERCLEPSYTTLKAYDGETGFSMVERMVPDLVICDLNMPGLSGHDFLRRVRGDQKLSGVKIIILTGSDSEEDMLNALEEGADAHLLKPVSLKELKVRIARLLEPKDNSIMPRARAETGRNLTRNEQAFLLRCREIIDAQISNDDFNISKMANMLAMSHSSLYKKIRAITGLSLISFINDYKIHKAVIMFRQGETNVMTVCEKCGFKDEKNFRDLFKKKTGQTPKQFVLELNTKNAR